MPWREYFSSVEGVAIAWLASVGLLIIFGVRALRNGWRPRWRELALGEEGVSYTMSYLLTIPFFLVLVCIVFESSLLMLSKFGTRYAAYAACRSAVVWKSAKPENLRDERIRQAAVSAITPFAHVNKRQLLKAGVPPAGSITQAGEYVLAFELYSTNQQNTKMATRPYVRGSPAAKLLFLTYLAASARTDVSTKVDPSQPNGDVTATVSFRAPLLFQRVSRLFAPPGSPPGEFLITSQVTLPNEAPVSDPQGPNQERPFGIDYQSR